MLSSTGYQQTKEKLAKLEIRLEQIEKQLNLSHQHRSEARRSYEAMITQYRREIKLYEAAHSENLAK